MAEPILTVEHLIKAYGETPVLDDISFAVKPGEVIVVVGPSGCGKSTLLRCLNGLEPTQSGRVRLGNETVAYGGKNLTQLRQRIGMVFQSYELFPHMTVLDNVLLAPTKVQKRPKAEVQQEAEALLDRVGLLAKKNSYPRELSGGQKRRVAVAGVMAMKPRILVLDEPAAGLDPEGRDDILSEVKEYHKKTGTTVLLVSHSMEDIAKYANRVLVMSNKKIAMYDTVEKVFARAPELLELGLSVPQVTKIFLKLREMGVDVPADVYTIPYAVKMILEAKRRREAGESLVLPREAKKEGGAAGC